MNYRDLLNGTLRSGIGACLAAAALAAIALSPAGADTIARWSFNQGDNSGNLTKIVGSSKRVAGVDGDALKLDGLGAYASVPANEAPKVSGAFAVEAWVALGCYPLWACPIIDQLDGNSGYALGIDEYGKVYFTTAVGGKVESVKSEAAIPFRKWQHVAGSFDPAKGLQVYVNGKPVGSNPAAGAFTPSNADLLVGRSRKQALPAFVIRPVATGEIYSFFDGILDDLTISSGSLTSEHLTDVANRLAGLKEPDLPLRVLPMGPKGPGKFGAYYTNLKFYDEWDEKWKVADKPDIIVRFDNDGRRFIFWHGMSYIPAWATDNGIWYSNEFNENWTDVRGSAEPMSDKFCRYSHVRVIESNDARVVVHWRYALVDNFLNQPFKDPVTGMGDWTDEIYTIYPDGVGTRKIILHSNQPMAQHEFQESFVLLSQGQRPEDCYKDEAVTLANLKGETNTYSWAERVPRFSGPNLANIEIFNIKSQTRPFLIVPDDPAPQFTVYAHEVRREYSIFPWWNHWPVAFNPSDGRWAIAADRIGHSSVSTGLEWKDYEVTADSRTRVMLHGLTDKPDAGIVQIGKSYVHAPKLTVKGDGFTGGDYDVCQRAYVLTKNDSKAAKLNFAAAASPDSPLVNPAFVVKNWGDKDVALTVNGKPIVRGKRFRVGHVDTLEGTDLVVWIEMEATAPTEVSLIPAR